MRRRRHLPVVAVLASVTMTGWLIQLPAGATSSSGPSATSHPSDDTQAAAAHGTIADLTLVTGHMVRFTKSPDGKQSAVVMETPEGASGGVITFTDGDGDLFVIPRQALPHLLSGLVDQRLFNVTGLVDNGYADGERDGIPLILTYPTPSTDAQVAAQARPLRAAGASDIRELTSADAVAMTVDDETAAQFWASIAGSYAARTAGPDLRGRATKIWLDGTVEASLDESVPLVGAPEAWADGYDGDGVTVAVLDSGYDPEHPDLAGRVADARGFDDTGAVADGNGHGTHVAATVAGGTRKGVAPGADLMIGKVLNDNGQGLESWVIAGMEWAAGNGADVINMSLGGGPTDGTDPLAQALNALTESTGALFVTAAGNSGPWPGTVDTPGVADAALTVGNTDKSDQLNESSSRGPRLGDHAVKPEIAAPGTDIVAARAAGTSIGSPVDEYYTSLTGTSMAAPHVAGAAAIVAQRHPDWTAAQIKSALVGHAHPLANGTAFDHGAGRLDVPAALDATVTTEQSTLSFGYLPWPNSDATPIERTVTYRNTGDTAVSLDLAVTADHSAGERLPDGAVTVDPATVVAEPGEAVSAVVTVVPELIEPGDVSGLLEAASGDTTVRTPWSFGEETEHYTLTVDAIGADGQPSAGWAMVWSEDMGQFFWGVQLDGTGPQTLRLPRDEYMVIGGSTVYGENWTILEETIGGQPQLDLIEDTTVTFDARDGDELEFRTPRPSVPTQLKLGWTRWYEGGGRMDGWVSYNGDLPHLAIAGSDPVRAGEFEFVAGGRLVAPDTPAERTPYLYDLLILTDGQVPASGTYDVGAAGLARIDSTFVGVGEVGRTTRENRDGFSPRGSTSVNWANAVHVAERTDYVSGGGVVWESMVRMPRPADEDVPTMWDNSRSYEGGNRYSTRWWGAPYSAGTDSDYSITDAYRDEDRLSILLRDYQDGEPDHWGDSYLNDHDLATVRSQLYRGGTLLADVKRGSFSVDGLPPEPATYRLRHTITRRGPIWTSSSYSESDWTFRSQRESVTSWPPAGIPLLDVNWTVPTDAQNRAADRSRFTIELDTRHVRDLPGGTIRRPRAWVSYDDGEHWRRIPLLGGRGNHYTGVLVHPPKHATSGWVSLRAEVTDSIGGSLTQTAIRAYGLE